MFHHISIIGLIHIGHRPAWMARSKVFLEQGVLFCRCPWAAFGDADVAITLQNAFLRGRRPKLCSNHPDGNAGPALKATGPVRHPLAAPKPDPAQRIVQQLGIRPVQFCKNFAFRLARKISARPRARDKETGKTLQTRHESNHTSLANGLTPRKRRHAQHCHCYAKGLI